MISQPYEWEEIAFLVVNKHGAGTKDIKIKEQNLKLQGQGNTLVCYHAVQGSVSPSGHVMMMMDKTKT